jgi:hypothetical protein
VFYEKVKTSQVYIRDCSMIYPCKRAHASVRINCVSSVDALLLFGGEVRVLRERGVISVDEWIKFRAPPEIGVLVRELRRELDELLLRKVGVWCAACWRQVLFVS